MVVNESEIQAKYEALRAELAQDRVVTLEFNDRWLRGMGAWPWNPPLASEPKNVRNLVFIVGGGNPTVFDYFQNYRYYQGTEVMYGGTAQWTYTEATTPVAYNQALFDSIPATGYTQEQLDAFVATVGDGTPVLTPTIIPSTKAACTNHDEGYFYETDYAPTLTAVISASFDDDYGFFAEEYSYYDSNRTFFFYDPLSLYMPEENASEDPYIYDYGSREHELSTFQELWWCFSGPPPGGACKPYPDYGLFGDHGSTTWNWCIWTGPVDIETYGAHTAYQCSVLTPEDGSVVDFLHKVFAYDAFGTPYETSSSVYRREGVDQSNDSTEVTESLLEETIATYGTGYDWTYEGRVDSMTLTADELIDMLPAEAFS